MSSEYSKATFTNLIHEPSEEYRDGRNIPHACIWRPQIKMNSTMIEKMILKSQKSKKNVCYTKDSAENSKHLGSTTF